MIKALVNGNWEFFNDDELQPGTDSFRFGSGLYETFRTKKYRPIFLKSHLDRLFSSAKKTNLKIIRQQTKLPVIVDAGIGQSSDAAQAMELGCDAVLINTAIAGAKYPYLMAEAMKYAVISGRKSYLSGRIQPNLFGSASTSNKGLI